jgi:LysR family transcriptional activator of nhaA
MALNFHHLRIFHAIAREGSLTRAAQHMHLSQSALSVQLQKLEMELGHPLFERKGRRMILTEAGRIALEYAEAAFSAGDELVSTLAGRPRASRRILRVGALTTLSRNFQLEFVRPLVARADVEIVIRSGTMRELLAQLEAQALDVVLANTAVRRDAQSAVYSQVLDQQPISLVGRPMGRRRKFKFPDDLRDRAILLPSPESDIRIGFDRMMQQAGIVPVIMAEVDDMAMLRLLARDSGGLTLVPPIVVRDELKSGKLVEYCRVPGLAETFYAIVRSRRFPNPLLAEVLPR